MAHPEQQRFFERIKAKYPDKFKGVSVADFGSMDLNGSLKDIFVDSTYVGVDIRPGKNVDVISKAHEYHSEPLDTVVSGEMLEHDEHWMASLFNMYHLLKDNGLMAISTAGWARWEHGTAKTDGEMGTSPDYYKDFTEDDFKRFIAKLPKPPKEFGIEHDRNGQDIFFYCVKDRVKVLCSISTKNRYETYLPMAIMSAINQTRKPDHLTIYDDNDTPRDLRDIEACRQLFQMLDHVGIGWDVQFGAKQGQHHNHQRANIAGYDAVWRIDDDCVAEADVLEKLLLQLTSDVGAIGGSILTPPTATKAPPLCSTKITQLNLPNKQWFPIDKTQDVDHLHCSFLYRTGIANYDLRLSKKAHREETMFTYAIKLKGYRVLITPCITWHLRSQTGGIRSDGDTSDYAHDEAIFQSWLNFKVTSKHRLYVLNNGLGDHFMFLQAVTLTPDDVVACCYPEVIGATGHKNVISIANAQQMVNIDDYDVYKWCIGHNWQGTLIEAFKKMYEDINSPR